MLPTACIKTLFHKLETGCFKATANKRLRTLSCVVLLHISRYLYEKYFSWNLIFMEAKESLVTRNHAEQKRRPWKDVSPPNAIFLDCKALTFIANSKDQWQTQLLFPRASRKVKGCNMASWEGTPNKQSLTCEALIFYWWKKGNKSFLHPCDWQLSHLSKRAGQHRE